MGHNRAGRERQGEGRGTSIKSRQTLKSNEYYLEATAAQNQQLYYIERLFLRY